MHDWLYRYQVLCDFVLTLISESIKIVLQKFDYDSSEKHASREALSFFYKKTSIKKRMLKWNQKVKLVKKV